MILIAECLNGIAVVLDLLLDILFYLLIIRVVVSWANPDPFSPFVRFLNSSTDPFLRPIRRYVKPIGMLDISPIVLFLIIAFLKVALVRSLVRYAATLA